VTKAARDAAAALWRHWQSGTRIEELPVECRPADRAAGYLTQQEVVALAGQPIAGWKIAATSVAGQKHIGVDGPIAGTLLANRVLPIGAHVPLDGNAMLVAEAEFAFTFGTDMPARPAPYSREDVLAAVTSLHPAVEIPDSRYVDFARVGAPQLIADTACSCWFVLGPATGADWRSLDLAAHSVCGVLNGREAATGTGANVLGDPLIALTWLVNELRTYTGGVRAGQFVTTGTCVVPVAIKPGDTFRADFGALGAVDVQLD
jgi:2-keto-4-pentenoate hydratase